MCFLIFSIAEETLRKTYGGENKSLPYPPGPSKFGSAYRHYCIDCCARTNVHRVQMVF